MRKHEVSPGTSIETAVIKLVKLANLHNEEVSMDFNEIVVFAKPGDDANELHAKWKADIDRRQEEYRNSAEGKRDAQEDEDVKNSLQCQIDDLMVRLETLDFENLDELLEFFDDMVNPSDHSGVSFDCRSVIDEFVKHGFAINANSGSKFDENNRENFAHYLIGQALSCLDSFGGVHPVYSRMASDWREKFASAGSSC